jgi:ketosteroid isomerase-like protein
VPDGVEIVRRGFEAFNDRDWEAVRDLCDPDVEWRPPRELPGSRLYRGPQGVEQAMRDLLDAFSDLRAEAHRVVDAGEGRVVALYVWRGSSASGLSVDPFEVHAGGLLEITGGAIRRAEFFTDWETPQRLAAARASNAPEVS